MPSVAEEIQATRALLLRARDERPEWNAARLTRDRLFEIAVGRCKEVVGSLSETLGSEWIGSAFQVTVPENGRASRRIAILLRVEKDACLSVAFDESSPLFDGLIRVNIELTSARGQNLWAGRKFLINYRESLENAERRFRLWLEEELARGLAAWRKALL
jgi:hypothetical protein